MLKRMTIGGTSSVISVHFASRRRPNANDLNEIKNEDDAVSKKCHN